MIFPPHNTTSCLKSCFSPLPDAEIFYAAIHLGAPSVSTRDEAEKEWIFWTNTDEKINQWITKSGGQKVVETVLSIMSHPKAPVEAITAGCTLLARVTTTSKLGGGKLRKAFMKMAPTAMPILAQIYTNLALVPEICALSVIELMLLILDDTETTSESRQSYAMSLLSSSTLPVITSVLSSQSECCALSSGLQLAALRLANTLIKISPTSIILMLSSDGPVESLEVVTAEGEGEGEGEGVTGEAESASPQRTLFTAEESASPQRTLFTAEEKLLPSKSGVSLVTGLESVFRQAIAREFVSLGPTLSSPHLSALSFLHTIVRQGKNALLLLTHALPPTLLSALGLIILDPKADVPSRISSLRFFYFVSVIMDKQAALKLVAGDVTTVCLKLLLHPLSEHRRLKGVAMSKEESARLAMRTFASHILRNLICMSPGKPHGVAVGTTLPDNSVLVRAATSKLVGKNAQISSDSGPSPPPVPAHGSQLPVLAKKPECSVKVELWASINAATLTDVRLASAVIALLSFIGRSSTGLRVLVGNNGYELEETVVSILTSAQIGAINSSRQAAILLWHLASERARATSERWATGRVAWIRWRRAQELAQTTNISTSSSDIPVTATLVAPPQTSYEWAATDSGWLRYATEEGWPYYFHVKTETVQWETPVSSEPLMKTNNACPLFDAPVEDDEEGLYAIHALSAAAVLIPPQKKGNNITSTQPFDTVVVLALAAIASEALSDAPLLHPSGRVCLGDGVPMLSQPDATLNFHWPHMPTTTSSPLATATHNFLIDSINSINKESTVKPLPIWFNSMASVGRFARSTVAVETSIFASLCVRTVCTERDEPLITAAASLVALIDATRAPSDFEAPVPSPLVMNFNASIATTFTALKENPMSQDKIAGHVKAYVCMKSTFDNALDGSYEPLKVDANLLLPSVESIKRSGTAWNLPWDAANAMTPSDAAEALDASGTKLGIRSAVFSLQRQERGLSSPTKGSSSERNLSSPTKGTAASSSLTTKSPVIDAVKIMSEALEMLQDHLRNPTVEVAVPLIAQAS